MKTEIRLHYHQSDIDGLEHPTTVSVQPYMEDLAIQTDDQIHGNIFYFEIQMDRVDKVIGYGVGINDLEYFAKSILAQIEVVRNTYGDVIKRQAQLGYML